MAHHRIVDLRRAAERRGRLGEMAAICLLTLKGYRILGRRVRTRAGEIDLVARSPGGIVCFVEVKVRKRWRDAQEALLPRQQQRIARAAQLYLAQWRELRPGGVRFDTVMVAGLRWPRHLRDAWRPGIF
jgi:putative endonuclease